MAQKTEKTDANGYIHPWKMKKRLTNGFNTGLTKIAEKPQRFVESFKIIEQKNGSFQGASSVLEGHEILFRIIPTMKSLDK